MDGRVVLYADKVTNSMSRAMEITRERRVRQDAYNRERGIVPRTVIKAVRDLVTAPDDDTDGVRGPRGLGELVAESADLPRTPEAAKQRIDALRDRMLVAAKALEFEQAAGLRDEVFRLESLMLEL